MQYEEIVTQLKNRIEILLEEISNLTEIINKNVEDQREISEKYF